MAFTPDAKGLATLEQAATALFGPEAGARRKASAFLAGFQTDPSFIAKCKWVFENYEKASFPCIYSLTLCSQSLKKLITRYLEDSKSVKSPDSLRNWLIDQIFRQRKQDRELPPNVSRDLIETLGRLVKIGWPKVYSLQTPALLLEAYTNLRTDGRKQNLAVRMLMEIVDAMAEPYIGEAFSDHRMRNGAFQQTALRDILKFGMDTLSKPLPPPVLNSVVSLCEHCLGFAFSIDGVPALGPAYQSEDMEKIRFPNSWKGLVADGFVSKPAVEVLLRPNNSLETTTKVLKLVQLLCAMGEEIFSSMPAYRSHISSLSSAVSSASKALKDVLRSSPIAFLDWCLVVVRLVMHGLEALAVNGALNGLLELATNLTIKALRGGPSTSYASQYLIMMWSRLAMQDFEARFKCGGLGMLPPTDSKCDFPAAAFLNKAIPGLVSNTVEMLLNFTCNAALNGEADKVIMEGDFQLFAEHLPVLVRHHYGSVMNGVLEKLRTTCVRWKAALGSNPMEMKEVLTLESHIACLVLLVSRILSSPNTMPLSHNYPKEHLAFDGRASILLMEVMTASTKRIKLLLGVHSKLAGNNTNTRTELQVLRAIDIGIVGFIDAFMLHCRSTLTTRVRDHRDLLVCAGLARLVPTFDEEGFDDLDFLVSMRSDEWSSMQASLQLSSNELRRLALEIEKHNRTNSADGGEASGSSTRLLSRGRVEPVMFKVLSTLCNRPIRQEETISKFFCKVIESLTFWSTDAKAVEACLTMLQSMVSGKATEETIRNAKLTKAILSKQASSFEFLARLPHSKLRSRFYSILGRLLFCRANRQLVPAFMQQFNHTLKQIQSAVDVRGEAVKIKAIGMCRDLNGLFDVIESKDDFTAVFNWIYPTRLMVLIRILETWWDEGSVSNSMLKLISSLVHNKNERIRFPPQSASGLKLFKEAAKVVTLYCSHLPAALEGGYESKDGMNDKLKGLQHCLSIITRALCGNYVCFDVFEMYNDECVKSAVSAVLKACLLLKPEDLDSMPKMFRRVTDFLGEVFTEHLEHFLVQPPTMFNRVLLLLVDGVCSDTDPVTVSNAAGALDCLFSFYYHHYIRPRRLREEKSNGHNSGHGSSTKKQKSMATKLQKLLNENSCRATVKRILPILFNLILFESSGSDHGCTKTVWCLSRPIATVIACDHKEFTSFRLRFVQSQPESEREVVDQAFGGLLENVKFDADYQGKNQFTRNMSRFSRLIKKMPRIQAVPII